ncbi:MAG TPA: hypothetical protein RMH85_13395 [Polyangiaceae bacterium LLY-WYZ-15_(1-7)]|nr:hypothetical protein [Sandaracinus sp.]HJL01708.1 hypothetical protein [Polyangiaceae bacterium LLY-WYZ-15_(1-7)]HJL09492.1 hypothetical protein [Polyangiaceae bacterium LLY-WYZ-15_(1-7)]
MPSPAHADCPRCARTVPVDRPWRGWVVVRGLWAFAVLVMMATAPAIAADALFLTPLAILLLGAGGFIIDRSREPARCRRCRYPLERRSETRRAPAR